MSDMTEVLGRLESWQQPPGGANPFHLECRLEPGATAGEVEGALRGEELPAELVDLWSAAREAWLFEDTEYGQWGLHLLNPSECRSRSASEREARPGDLLPDDLVVGEFLGDSDLLVVAPSEQGERRVLVALPLDSRDEWFAAGPALADVLRRLLETNGEKYWENFEA